RKVEEKAGPFAGTWLRSSSTREPLTIGDDLKCTADADHARPTPAIVTKTVRLPKVSIQQPTVHRISRLTAATPACWYFRSACFSYSWCWPRNTEAGVCRLPSS